MRVNLSIYFLASAEYSVQRESMDNLFSMLTLIPIPISTRWTIDDDELLISTEERGRILNTSIGAPLDDDFTKAIMRRRGDGSLDLRIVYGGDDEEEEAFVVPPVMMV